MAFVTGCVKAKPPFSNPPVAIVDWINARLVSFMLTSFAMVDWLFDSKGAIHARI
jgi:hypothetical protein